MKEPTALDRVLPGLEIAASTPSAPAAAAPARPRVQPVDRSQLL